MISTYLGYTIATRNMTTTLNQVASQSQVKREQDYYNANIGKVTNVDDFLGNYQLYSYAMTAYGLEDMTYAKGFMKEVLTSDLTDPNSFANKLSDPRYKEFAAAFNFGTSTTQTAQSSTEEDDMIGLYQQSFTTEADDATTESDYYAQAMDSVTNVDDFLSNDRLKDYVLKAYGIDPTNVSDTFLKQMLTSDVNDPNSFVNVNGSAADKAIAAQFSFNSDGTIKASTADDDMAYYQAQIGSVTTVGDLTSNTRLFDIVKTAYGLDSSVTADEFNAAAKNPTLAQQDGLSAVLSQFNFESLDGNVPTGQQVQTSDQIQTTVNNYSTNYVSHAQTEAQKAAVMSQYNFEVPSYTTDTGAIDNDAYYKQQIGSITSVSQLTSDPRLFDYIKTAFNLSGLEPGESDDILAFDFTQSVKDPTYASLTGFSSIVAQFNFQTDGTVAAGSQAQSSDQVASTSSAYMSEYKSEQTALVTDATKNYQTRMASVKNINDFFATNASDDDSTNDNLPELYQVALRAFGISPDEMSKSQMKKVLESDPYDPKSYVSSLKDPRFTALAKAFNFDSKGNIKAQPVQALSQSQINSYISEYSSQTSAGLTGNAQTQAIDAAKTAGTYFATNILNVNSVSDLLKDSKLTDFVLTANGIDPKTVTTATLKKAFAADPSDPKSFLNTTDGEQFKSIVEAFNFGTDGNLTDTKLGTAQNAGALDATDNLFLHQTLEDQQGETNPGVRLALYFQRKAPDINSIYDIMGDSALYEVITTTYSLPSSISSMNVDDQAKMLSNFVNVKDLQDPDKVNKLLQRFSAMYDIQNNTTQSTSPALQILSGSSSGSIGVSADTLLSIAQLSSS
ncbi:MAG: DUF1217 domain-containing protein [Rhizobiaceae bacterium]|nr:DUF1217 domain-containing protein [Rhizobiaceae bacterium]